MPNKRGSGGFGPPSNKNGKPAKKSLRRPKCPAKLTELESATLTEAIERGRRLFARLEYRQMSLVLGYTSDCLSDLADKGEREQLATCLKEALDITKAEARQNLDELIYLFEDPPGSPLPPIISSGLGHSRALICR